MYENLNDREGTAKSVECGSGLVHWENWKEARDAERVAVFRGEFTMREAVLSLDPMVDLKWCNRSGRKEGRYTSIFP